MMDQPHRKKIIFILLGVIIIGLVGVALYRSLVPARPPPTLLRPPITPGGVGTGIEPPLGEEIPPPTPPTGEIPTEQPRLVQLTTFPVVGPSLNADEDRILFYEKEGGDLLSINLEDLSQEKLSNLTIVQLLEVVWSPRRDRRAVFYLDGETWKGFLHIGTSSVATLPTGLTGLAWSRDGTGLAYLSPQGERVNLVVADASGQNPRTIFSTPLLDATIQWVGKDLYVFQTAPSSQAEGYLFGWSPSPGVLTRLLGPLRGLTARWSPDGSIALISHMDSLVRRPAATLWNRTTSTSTPLSVATLAEKCTWQGVGAVYCAVPREIPVSVSWPDSYLQGEFSTRDRVVAIDAGSGRIREVWNEESFDITDPIITKNGDHFFFINRRDGTLWMLRIK